MNLSSRKLNDPGNALWSLITEVYTWGLKDLRYIPEIRLHSYQSKNFCDHSESKKHDFFFFPENLSNNTRFPYTISSGALDNTRVLITYSALFHSQRLTVAQFRMGAEHLTWHFSHPETLKKKKKSIKYTQSLVPRFP